MPLVRGLPDRPALVSFTWNLVEQYEIPFAAIEFVHSHPQNGVKQAFSFGAYSEMMKMACVSVGVHYHEIRPDQWQTLVDIPPKAPGMDTKSRREIIKECVQLQARERWPDIPMHAKADSGMADAAFIAEWCRIKCLG